MESKQIAIYGAGGFAREVAWLVQELGRGEVAYEVVCFIDDNEAAQCKMLNDIEVMGLKAARRRFPEAMVVGGVGSPGTMRAFNEQSGRGRI